LTFDINKTIEYWLESAEYDLETGRSLIESGRYPYALFFGHLTIEKTLKAIVVKSTKTHAPFSHSLILLAKHSNVDIPEDIFDKLAEYMEFHIESRYPDEKKNFYDKCTEEFARLKFSEMEETYRWLIQKLRI
jgi:HEPN domain-containing protein